MEAERKTFAHDLKKNVRRRLVTGLLVVFPIFVTFFVIKLLPTEVRGLYVLL
jgi:uncharacterized membrane protein